MLHLSFGQKVRVTGEIELRKRKKCKTYPYCDQGSGGPSGSPITLSDTSEMDIDGYFNEGRVVKTIKKGKLKIK
jgi:hypothetical protein